MTDQPASLDSMWDAANAAPTGTDLNRIGTLLQTREDALTEIGMAEEALRLAKERLLDIETKQLPEAMAQAGTGSFTTLNGQLTVTVEDHVSGSLASAEKSPEVRSAQIKYVVDNDGAGIVSADVVLKFGRTNRAAALETAKQFAGRDDCAVTVQEDIHHSTLKSWARKQLAAGKPLDGEKCGLWIGKKAKVKENKPK